MNWNHIRRALVLSTSSVLMTANIASAQDGALVPMANSDESAAAAPAPEAQVSAQKIVDASAISAPVRVFVHRATAANTSGHITTIDDPLSNGNPAATVIVTANWNPNGVGGVYNDHPVGVYYSGGKWRIFNQDIATMPDGAAFNVRIGPGFVHEANPSNIVGHWTEIDNPLTNNNPAATVVVTQNWNPGGVSGVYNNHTIGVWYRSSTGRWCIYNEDIAPMPNGAAFNVVAADPVVHKALAGNISSNWTKINDPRTNSKSKAIVFSTHNFNPGGAGGTYEGHETGVWYTGTQWAIYNQDGAAMAANTSFNVLVYNVPTITEVRVRNANMIFIGESFSSGAVVMVNSVDRPTVNNLVSPTTKLKVKQTLNTIPPGTTVTTQVRNADGLLSDPVPFTR